MPRKRLNSRRPWKPGSVSYHQEGLGLTKEGSLVTGSKAVVRAKVSGTGRYR